jgi:hypothetical protein
MPLAMCHDLAFPSGLTFKNVLGFMLILVLRFIRYVKAEGLTSTNTLGPRTGRTRCPISRTAATRTARKPAPHSYV